MNKLPILTDLPTYTIPMPSGTSVTFRPYMVKERKILLMALENENGDETGILQAIRQIVTNCVVSPEGFDPDKIPSFDLEYLFLQLRARSIGETIERTYICKNDVNGSLCNTQISIELNLLNIKANTQGGDNRLVHLTEKVGMMMRYPTIEMSLRDGDRNSTELALDYIANCVEYIIDGDDIIQTKDLDKDEVVDFIERLSIPQFEKIEKFFDTLPFIRETLSKDCPKCGFHHEIVMEGLQSFFD